MRQNGIYDAIVIGGGPGGATAATLLSRAGRKVLVLEKEHFPRFHIGESLLPYNRRLFEEIGVVAKLENAGFPRKFGAQFHLGNGSKVLKLVFQNGVFTHETSAYQVERAKFDDILLKHAGESGAEVREGWTVTKFIPGKGSVLVEARSPNGALETFQAAFLADASGRANITGNQEGLRVIHPDLKKLALFGHFDGVALDEAPKADDTIIVRLENKWFWIIPLGPNKISVGCVMDQQEFAKLALPPAEVFSQMWQSSSEMRERMKNARLLSSIQSTSDFSYHNRRLVGPRLLRIGDAAGFMDPIFSAGVYLAMNSGKLAAEVISESLKAGDDGTARLRMYEKKVFHTMRYYWDMVDKFYTQPFMELFLQPRPKFNIPDAIVAILAGELDGGWRVELRRQIFFLLIWIQGRWPIIPRVSFEDSLDEACAAQPKSLAHLPVTRS
jgi:flavin-dependent dehydrogenase